MSDLYLQPASKLFIPPIEIRRAIYVHLINFAGVHIGLTQQGNLQLCACVGPDQYAGLTGKERGGYGSEPMWGPRLVSLWGPHWECEEIALRAGKRNENGNNQIQATWRDNRTILTVCKRMSNELIEIMTELVCFTVTDLSTLDKLLGILATAPSGPCPPIPFTLKDSLLSYIKKLDVTLRLPLPFFKALDGSQVNEDELSPDFEQDLKIWSNLSLRIGQLKELRSLRIWLDHTAEVYWSFVNERAILSQFETLVSNSHLDLFFDLPRLHPEIEDPERHYTTEENTVYSSFSTLSPLKIHRILRQRHFARKTRSGHYFTFYVQDFPESLGHPITFQMSPAERDHWERSMWVAGCDVKSMLSGGIFYKYSR